MAIIDADFWTTRRKLSGACGAFILPRHLEISGKSDFAPYVRARPTPCHTPTPRQTARKATWSRLHRSWTTNLSDADRADWNDHAADYSYRDHVEQLRPMNGLTWYCALGARALLAGFDPITNPVEIGIPGELDTLDFSFLDENNIRITFSPDEEPWLTLVVYGRGPTPKGVKALVRPTSFSRDATPRGFHFIGASPLNQKSPLDMPLTRAVPSGRKLTITACLMDYTGYIADDWITAEHVKA